MTKNQVKRKRKGGKHRVQIPWQAHLTANARFDLAQGANKRKGIARRKKKIKKQTKVTKEETRTEVIEEIITDPNPDTLSLVEEPLTESTTRP